MRWRVLTCFAKFGTGFSHVRTGILWVRAGFHKLGEFNAYSAWFCGFGQVLVRSCFDQGRFKMRFSKKKSNLNPC
jgi:hypothetical protein